MYPVHARNERIADGAVHVAGVVLALIGAIWLVVLQDRQAGGVQTTAVVIYGFALIATFVASATYHLAPWHALRPMLRRVDHAAIYLKIAGTYTPFVVMLGTPLGYSILALVWALALFGITRKLFFWQAPGRFGPALYLIMGWLSVILMWAIWGSASQGIVALMIGGGALYTGGVVLYKSKRHYTTALWHGCVVIASACFWGAVMLSLMPASA